MEMKLFNITSDELAQNKHSIFIGISVGIKPMTVEIATAYLSWALEHSSRNVQILIADEIARYNYLVFSHYTKKGALARAIRDGDIYMDFFQNVISSNFSEKTPFIDILRWKDIKCERFLEILDAVQAEFMVNKSFQEDLYQILDPYVERRGKSITVDQKVFLAQYLIEELATLLDGIYVKEINYRLILYPTYRYSGMSQLVSDIQHRRKYASLAEKLKLNSTSMVESLIENDDQPSLSFIGHETGYDQIKKNHAE